MSDSIKLYMDEQIPSSVTKALRQHNVDIQTVQEAGLRGEKDRRQLDHAAREGRVMVTMDDDFLGLHSEGIPHAGIAFIPPRYAPHVGSIIDWLLLLTRATIASQMKNDVEYCFDPSEV